MQQTKPRRGGLVESNPHARKKGGRNLGIGRGVKAGIDGGEEGLFLGEGGTARGAPLEMRAQLALRSGAGGGNFD